MVTVKGSEMWFFRGWKNSMTDGLVGVGGTSSSSGIHKKGTSLRLDPNSRMTLIMPDGAVAKRVTKDHGDRGIEYLKC